MENIFLRYPEFIETDVRTRRVKNKSFDMGYNINPELQFHRHRLTLPDYLVQDKTILDLGCCGGATGAWVLSHGARHYTGVELQSKFCDLAKNNLSKYFNQDSWEIKEQSFNEFFINNINKFDIVVALGVLYHSADYIRTLENFSKLSLDRIIIDSYCPSIFYNFFKEASLDTSVLKNVPYVEYPGSTYMVHETGKSVRTDTVFPSAKTVEHLLNFQGFALESDLTDDVQNLLPNDYNERFLLTFKKTNSQKDNLDFETVYRDKSKQEFLEFNENNKWSFNSSVAKTFVSHAIQHIPNYQQVITQSIEICKKLIKDSSEDRIIDVGCATGETIKRLYQSNFHNLVGVDNSSAMLAKVQDLPIAHWIHSDQFPVDQGPYSAILCNWTLHFIRDKLAYLQDIYQGLSNTGFLILTDKTCDSGIDLELYHDFKRAQGVTEEEIRNKAESLRGVMYIDNPDWYLNTLQNLGFAQVSIINSAPCFTTFLAIKN